jgi:hypothetical protein
MRRVNSSPVVASRDASRVALVSPTVSMDVMEKTISSGMMAGG